MPITKILENGKCIKLAPNEPEIYGSVETGKLIVEGRNLYDSESNFIKDRRRFSFEGIIMVTIIINEDYSLNKQIKISANGLPDFNQSQVVDDFKKIFIQDYLQLNSDKKSSDELVSNLIKKSIRKSLKNQLTKKPEVNSHIIRI